MDLFATVLATTAAIELVAALLLTLAFVRSPGDREFGLAAVVSLAAAGHALGTIASERALTIASAALYGRMSAIALAVAVPTCVHFALAYRGNLRRRWPLSALYGGGTALAAIGALAPPTDRPPFGRMTDLLEGAYAFMGRSGPLDPATVALHTLVVAATSAALALVARAYLSGQRGALAVVVGTTVLLATAINDVGVATGAFATGFLIDAGFAAFVVGVATTPGARYAAASQELARRTGELRTRTRELRRSYEDLRAAQEELVKKEQLAVVGELAAVIAHEVRNPLAIIANAVAGLRKPALSREDHDVLLAILDEETSRLNRLVTDLLRYARPVNLQRSQISLRELLERALALANTGAKRIKIELKVEAHEGRLWGDPNLLRQVFDNLIDNALQAMGADGNLTVRVRAIASDGTDGLAVEIIDTGEGMDTQVRSRALDPFFTTRPSGTGLGLAIVDRIVDAHGGRLGIDSRTGEGTTVTVFLPHGSPSEPPPAPRRARLSASDVNA